jgi:DNA-directed RNA polymerase omega subunit
MDLISLPTELDREKIDNRYRLVIAAGKRAKALRQGAMPKIVSSAKKVTTVALKEVISGSVRVLSGEVAVKAKAEAKKRTHQMMDEAGQKASLPEEMTKIEKDLQIYLRKKEEEVVEKHHIVEHP